MMPNVERVFAKSKAATRTSLSGAAWTHDGRYSVALAWLMGVLLVFMVVPEGLDYTARAVIVSTGSTLSRLIWISLLAVSFVVVIGRLRFVRIAVGAVNPFLLLFIVIVAASAAWSIEPAVTVRRLVRMFTIVLCCFAFTLMAWHPRRFQNVLRSVLTGMLVASLVFCVVRPDLAIEQSTQPELIGAWHGIATQKNGFGALSSMGMIVWLHARLTRQVSLIAVLFGLGVSAACLTLSRSSTAMVTAAFVAVLLFLLLGMPTRMRRFLPYMTVTFVVLILTYSLAVLQLIPGLAIVLEPITMMTGKDLSFTGRTHIWAIMSEHIRQHPMLGIGYGAFWIGPLPTSPSFEFITRLNFYPTEAHNGYLEVLNELGAVGGVCLAGFICVYVRQCLQLVRLDRGQSALYLGLLFQLLLTNLSESHWFNAFSVDFAIVIFASLAMARGLLEFRLRHLLGDPNSRLTSPGIARTTMESTRRGAAHWYRP